MTSFFRVLPLLLGLCLACAFPGTDSLRASRLPADRTGPGNLSKLKAFVDHQITRSMKENRIPGMAFVMVKDATGLPARVTPPGTLYSYSNLNTSLAGYIAEIVSHTPYERYMQRHVLLPLRMRHSTFQQPLPESMASDLATGYDGEPGARSRQASPFEYLKQRPAASLSATTTDVAHFMIAQLEGGRYGSGRVLHRATVHTLQAMHYSDYPNAVDRPLTTNMAYTVSHVLESVGLQRLSPNIESWATGENIDWSGVQCGDQLVQIIVEAKMKIIPSYVPHIRSVVGVGVLSYN